MSDTGRVYTVDSNRLQPDHLKTSSFSPCAADVDKKSSLNLFSFLKRAFSAGLISFGFWRLIHTCVMVYTLDTLSSPLERPQGFRSSYRPIFIKPSAKTTTAFTFGFAGFRGFFVAWLPSDKCHHAFIFAYQPHLPPRWDKPRTCA